MRKAEIIRTTSETDIKLSLNLDGRGNADINTGVPFLDHMLNLFARHSMFDLTVSCKGDTDIDAHHTTEDIGIALGKAFKEALGDKKGITRYGDIILPMDEALILVATDLSGRAFLSFDVEIYAERVGNFDTELLEEFLRAFAFNAEINLHIKKLDGRNAHHIIEGAFKALARALRKASSIDKDNADTVPSTKGVL
jgi:imidazoleglycerol-phosphate dehydratase